MDDDIVDALGQIRSDDERRLFLDALLTPAELTMLTKRWRIYLSLLDERPQRQIRDRVQVGLATVNHAARLLPAHEPILRVVANRCADNDVPGRTEHRETA